MNDTTILLAAGPFLVVSMACAWAVQRVTRNCGWVDGIWSAATAFAAAAACLLPARAGPRSWLAAGMVLVWGGRLAAHILRRTPGAPEDARYAAFRLDWGAAFETRLFWFLMIQAACAWVLVASVWLAAHNTAPLGLGDIAGVVLLVVAVAGETLADTQMQRFRAARSGGVCDTGLWGFSRHPNYFFEFLGWCAYPLLAIDVSGFDARGWLALSGPAMMYWLLRYASGVPPLEASMLARRGAAFADYQARVNVFFPGLPKRRREPRVG